MQKLFKPDINVIDEFTYIVFWLTETDARYDSLHEIYEITN